MGTNKEVKLMEFKDKINNVQVFGYTSIQSAMLFFHYGMGYVMPWWVIWFPTLVISVLLAIVAVVLLIIGMLMLVRKMLD